MNCSSVKFEDMIEGFIKCPKCNNMKCVAPRGCNLVTCTNQNEYHQSWYYFCYHCKGDLHNGIPCSKCPYRNTAETRQVAQETRNETAKENPVFME